MARNLANERKNNKKLQSKQSSMNGKAVFSLCISDLFVEIEVAAVLLGLQLPQRKYIDGL